MSRGKRYSDEGKLNYKKVFAVIIAIIVIIMFIVIVKNIISKGKGSKTTQAADYYALYENDAWGILGSNGETIIEPMYQEMLIVINNKKDVFLCTYDVNEETGEYKTKAINSKNQEIFTGYDKVEALENYDSDGNAWYEEDVIRVEKDGKYGLINLDGKEILSAQYDSIETLKGIKNSLIVTQDGKYGLVNASGVIIISPEYKQIEKFGDDYKEGYITINQDGKYGLVSYSGTQILENKYEKIESIYGENYFVIKEGKKQKVISTDGTEVLTEGYDEIKQIAKSGVVFVKEKKYGIMGYDGKVKVEAKYEDLKEINSDIFAAKSKQYGIIDIDGNEKVSFNYNNIYYDTTAGLYIAEDSNYTASIMDTEFNTKLIGVLCELNTEDGYMKLKVADEYKYYNFKFEEKEEKEIFTSSTLFVSKKDGKYGFVDKDGNVVVDYIYDDVTEQNSYGYAAIKQDGKWGAIDSEGNIVAEPTYNLDANLVIDFIGKWHLGQDLNMNYYCKK